MIKTSYMDGHMVGYRVVQVVLFDQNMAILGLRKLGKNEVGWERVARRADLEQSYVLAESTNTDRQRLAISFVICCCFHSDFFSYLFPFSILLPCPLSFFRCWYDRQSLLSNKFCHLEPLTTFTFLRRRLTPYFAQDKATHSLGVGDKFHYLLPSSGENLNFKFQS